MILPDAALFEPGQLVKHVRYGYRGVVVDYDDRCCANPQWYANNQTQPDQEQPWYHVLVHQALHTTYAAQTSLEADSSLEPIIHPWVEEYFDGFAQGIYQRNSKPFVI